MNGILSVNNHLPISGSTKGSRRRTHLKRKRKSNQQVAALQMEFEVNSDWGKEQLARLSKVTGLSQAQVYKWGWDQKKKLQFSAYSRQKSVPSLSVWFDSGYAVQSFKVERQKKVFQEGEEYRCEEVLEPCQMDQKIRLVQRMYRRAIEGLIIL